MPLHHIAVLPHAPADEDLATRDLLNRVTELEDAVWREVYGTDDFDHPPGAWAAELAAQESTDRLLLIALAGPAPSDADRWHGLPVVGTGTDPGRTPLGMTFAS